MNATALGDCYTDWVKDHWQRLTQVYLRNWLMGYMGMNANQYQQDKKNGTSNA